MQCVRAEHVFCDDFIFVQITVKAKFDYKAQQSDELSFCKHSIITNVVKPEGSDGWWRGDYGGKKQHYFPAIYVVEIQRIDPDDAGDESVSENFF